MYTIERNKVNAFAIMSSNIVKVTAHGTEIQAFCLRWRGDMAI